MERAGPRLAVPDRGRRGHGAASILARLPRIVSRVYGTVDAAVAAEPDAVVIIDSPEFTHPIAKRIRKRAPISRSSTTCRRACGRGGRAARARCAPTSITCWRCCRSSPDAHQRLGGPPCTYVGHPLIERLRVDRRRSIRRRWPRACSSLPTRLLLVVLPGSRPSEVGRLMRAVRRGAERLHRARPHPSAGDHSRGAVTCAR